MSAAVGTVRVPGDKSVTHRLLMLGAVASGVSRIRGALASDDTRSTAAAMRALGAEVPEVDREEMVVRGRGWGGLRAPDGPIDCGNSGTTVRLLMGLSAGRGISATFTGDASLRRRPMSRITRPLTGMGAEFHFLEEDDRLPLTVGGRASRPTEYRSPHASAQVKSAVLLAGLGARAEVVVIEPVQSRDHTERLLRSLGATVTEAPAPDGWRVALSGAPEQIDPLDARVPGDISSAAFPAAYAAMADGGAVRIEGVGVNPTRTGFLQVLGRMGAEVVLENAGASSGEPIADLVVRGGALRAAEVQGEEIPSMIDELPAFAVLAARAEGESRVSGAAELRVKESDRISAIVANLRALGTEAAETVDGFVVRGSERPPRGRVRTFGDHRIAMAFGLLARLPGADVTLDAPEDVRISYPGYWTMLDEISGRTR